MAPAPVPTVVVTPLLTDAQREILIAAAGGSILQLLFLGETFSWKVASTAVFSGIFTAYYSVELIAGYFKLGPGYMGALGAAVGLGAMTVIGGVFKLLKSWRDDPAAFIQRFASYVPFLRKGG